MWGICLDRRDVDGGLGLGDGGQIVDFAGIDDAALAIVFMTHDRCFDLEQLLLSGVIQQAGCLTAASSP